MSDDQATIIARNPPPCELPEEPWFVDSYPRFAYRTDEAGIRWPIEPSILRFEFGVLVSVISPDGSSWFAPHKLEALDRLRDLILKDMIQGMHGEQSTPMDEDEPESSG